MTVQESSHKQPGAITHRDEYHPDLPSVKHTLVGIVAAALGGLVFTLACWFVLKTTNLPAFGPSMVSRALATFGTIILLVSVATLVVLWVMDEKKKTQRPVWRTTLSYALCYLSPAGLVVTTTAIPLSATRLYLDGITIDQGFRTQFMTRLADSWALSDMNYIDLPTFYPGMWFWFGGRMANILGIPGWEVFQPWSLMSIAAAACVLVPVWQRLVGSLPVATGIALVSVATTLVMSAEEPYAAIIALGVPAACILARRALVGRNLAMVGLIFYLGMSASAYTLYTAVVALSAIVIAALYAAALMKSATPIIRLVIIGVASMSIAALWWGPYIFAILSGHPTSGATAAHYLPLVGTQVPLPMLAPTLIGVLCLVGLVYIIMRASNYDVRMLGIGLIVFYGWIALSMAFTVTGTTLLGFRLDVVVALQLATAGVLGFAELRIYSIHRLFPEAFDVKTSQTITVVFVAILMAAGLGYAQNIPNENANAIDLAYTDTDGYGERADRYPPDATQYYAEIANHITEKTDKLPRDTVILTDERNFMSYHPFRGFQAFTSHYANPLGEFDRRNEEITSWALGSWNKYKTPQTFVEKLDEAKWKAPEVFVFRADLESTIEDMNSSNHSTGWVFDLAEDIYPNNPNVRFHGVRFNPEVFLGSGTVWDAAQIGPFVVVTRS